LIKKFADKEIAARLGRTVPAVQRRRRKLGLPQIDPPFVWWTPKEDKLLGTAPDVEIARKLGRYESSVRGRRLLLGIKFPNLVDPGQAMNWHYSESCRIVFLRKGLIDRYRPFVPSGSNW
jgi:hypothetical protein